MYCLSNNCITLLYAAHVLDVVRKCCRNNRKVQFGDVLDVIWKGLLTIPTCLISKSLTPRKPQFGPLLWGMLEK